MAKRIKSGINTINTGIVTTVCKRFLLTYEGRNGYLARGSTAASQSSMPNKRKADAAPRKRKRARGHSGASSSGAAAPPANESDGSERGGASESESSANDSDQVSTNL